MIFKKLNEKKSTRVKNVLYGDVTGKIKTFAILTAENPMAKEFTNEENNKRTDSLKNDMRKMGVQYIPIQGFFGRKEHSFILPNVALKDAKYLSNKYEQLSFFFGKVHTEYSEIEYWEKPDVDSEYNLIETSDRVDNAKDFDDYFSRFHNFKYSIYMKIFNESIDIKNPTYIDRAIDESLTLHGRADARHLAYKKDVENDR